MAAPDLDTLFDFETQIETAIDTVLTTAGLTATKQRDTSDLASPFVAVQFVQGETLGNLYIHTDSVKREDRWNGEIILTITTQRQKNNSSHATYRKAIRKEFANWQNQINAQLTYLILLDCKTMGSTPEIAVDENHDQSVMRYGTPFAIRSSAWPV